MNIKFENGEVPIWKIRFGTVVRFNTQYFHVHGFIHTADGRFLLDIRNRWESSECNPKFIEWLEPM